MTAHPPPLLADSFIEGVGGVLVPWRKMFWLSIDLWWVSLANRLGMRTLRELVNGRSPDPFMSGIMNPVGTSHLDGGILWTERLLMPSGIWSSSGTQHLNSTPSSRSFFKHLFAHPAFLCWFKRILIDYLFILIYHELFSCKHVLTSFLHENHP